MTATFFLTAILLGIQMDATYAPRFSVFSPLSSFA
jgi:hypothetical protein